MRRALALLALAPLLLAAGSPRLVPDVSQREIDIIYSFTGAQLLVFGAILYPGGREPDDPADIVVVLKGPTEAITVREKAKVAGIWVNADSARFRSAPTFYAVASSRPLSRIVDARTAAIYELGLGNLQLSPTSAGTPGEAVRFESGLVDLRRRGGMYVEEKQPVEISDGVLYRARIDLPARVPEGRYTAETFLIQDGRVVAAAVRPIDVRKQGMERAVAVAAQENEIVYGLAAVLLSLGLGWLAGLMFRKR